MIWNLECPVGLSQKRNVRISNEGNLAQFGRSAEREKEGELRNVLELAGGK